MIVKKVCWKKIAPALVLILALGAYYQFCNVATVNGRLISRFKYVKSMEKQIGEQTLDQMVTEALILGEAQKKGVKIEDAEVEVEISKIEEQIKAQGQTLEAALEMEGMSRADLEKQIRTQKMVESMAGDGEEVSQEDIDAFLEKYKDQLPEDSTKEELQDLAKEQLSSQAVNEAINTWLADLKAKAKIYYR